MNLPTVSVILPNYNHGDHLPIAIDAIMQQSAQPLEVIVIDDGSTDQSRDLIKALACRHPTISWYRNDQNRGVCFTVNRGIDLARGEYVFCTAADDVIRPGFFEKSLRLLAEHPHAGLSCTISDWRELDSGLHWHMGVGMANSPTYLSPERIVELERANRFFISTNTVIAKRSALIRAGKYIPALKNSVDWFAATVIALQNGICVVPEPLCLLQIQSNSFYQRSRRDKEGHRAVLQHIVDLLLQPKFTTVRSLIKHAGSLYIFGLPMLRILRSRREYRHFLTPLLCRKAVWHSTKVTLKRFTPASIGNIYLRLSGHWTPGSPS
jgi:glycosyltransferase involved in cell wall biosynthesis